MAYMLASSVTGAVGLRWPQTCLTLALAASNVRLMAANEAPRNALGSLVLVLGGQTHSTLPDSYVCKVSKRKLAGRPADAHKPLLHGWTRNHKTAPAIASGAIGAFADVLGRSTFDDGLVGRWGKVGGIPIPVENVRPLLKRMIMVHMDALLAKVLGDMDIPLTHDFRDEVPLPRWIVSWAHGLVAQRSELPVPPNKEELGDFPGIEVEVFAEKLAYIGTEYAKFWSFWVKEVLDENGSETPVPHRARVLSDRSQEAEPSRGRSGRTELIRALEGSGSGPTLAALTADFDGGKSPNDVVNAYLETKSPSDVPEALFDAWRRLGLSESSACLQAWIQVLVPALIGRENAQIIVEARSGDGMKFAKVPVSTYDAAEFLFAAHLGRGAGVCLERSTNEKPEAWLDSSYRIPIVPTTITGELGAKNMVRLQAEQFLDDLRVQQFRTQSRVESADERTITRWHTGRTKKRKKMGYPTEYVAFKPFSAGNPTGVHESWARDLWQHLPQSAEIDVLMLSVDAAESDFIADLPGLIENWITPIFEDKKS